MEHADEQRGRQFAEEVERQVARLAEYTNEPDWDPGEIVSMVGNLEQAASRLCDHEYGAGGENGWVSFGSYEYTLPHVRHAYMELLECCNGLSLTIGAQRPPREIFTAALRLYRTASALVMLSSDYPEPQSLAVDAEDR